MRRIAQHADGWNVVGVPLRSVSVMFEAIKDSCREIGREPGELELVVRTLF
jgi:alkanesulfonate monooxygenase SsuD/methylene tetrahydromethanopterin reductase-like flavin-dependent oxidoreductase (luciferase family)